MENLDQFIAEQNKALEKKKAEIAELANLGEVDGLEPWLIFSKLYGVRHIGFKLVDLEKFVAWAKENCRRGVFLLVQESGPPSPCGLYRWQEARHQRRHQKHSYYPNHPHQYESSRVFFSQNPVSLQNHD